MTEDRHGAEINVRLTNEERQALDAMATMQEMTPERVMIQALRVYQLVTIGGGKVVWPRMDLEPMGCGNPE